MKISVCIPTYNGEKYIKEQLASILNQLSPEDEVIISDDSSSDQTLMIVASFKDSRIKVFANQKFRNPMYNLENTLQKAQGDIIFLADQDDIWNEGKISIMQEYLRTFDLVVCDCCVVNDNLEIIHPSYFDLLNSGRGVLKNLYKNTYLGCCMAFNRKILANALPFPPDIPMHDIWLGFVSDVCGKSVFIKDKLTLYRRHQANASSTTTRSRYSFGQKIKFRWNIIKYLPRLLLKRK